MRVTSTWKDNWNNVIRDVIFPDTELLGYMMIPTADQTNIVKFINEYFIRDPAPDELVTNEKVRIAYGENEGKAIGSNMVNKVLFFDVYVKNEHLHDTGTDYLKSRIDLICQKLKEDLTTNKYVCRLSFTYLDDYDLYTKLVGYKRHRITFTYKISF